MAKRTPLPCTPANCGAVHPRCGRSGYTHDKCRCEKCYQANSDYMKQYRLENRKTILAYKERYRSENPEKCAEGQKRWREAHRETLAESKKRYAAENSEKVAEGLKRWALANPERVREQGRRSAGIRRARKKAVQVIDFTPEQLEQKMAYYGNSCYLKIPGLCTGAFDEVEHVKPISKGGPHMIANFRPSCEPCNRRKFNHWPFKLAG